MTYSIIITMTRPNKQTSFLPQDSHNMQAARKASSGYIREERMHDQNVMTITHVWENKAAYEAFEAANKDALDAARASREKHFTDSSIAMTTTWVDE